MTREEQLTEQLKIRLDGSIRRIRNTGEPAQETTTADTFYALRARVDEARRLCTLDRDYTASYALLDATYHQFLAGYDVFSERGLPVEDVYNEIYAVKQMINKATKTKALPDLVFGNYERYVWIFIGVLVAIIVLAQASMWYQHRNDPVAPYSYDSK